MTGFVDTEEGRHTGFFPELLLAFSIDPAREA
jgi:hypothetical protein